jgi:hypothetical protein
MENNEWLRNSVFFSDDKLKEGLTLVGGWCISGGNPVGVFLEGSTLTSQERHSVARKKYTVEKC